MKKLQKQKMQNLVKENLLISTGCTEPIAIAYAAAKARETLKEEPDFIKLKLSGNMAKNAMDAGVPGSKYVGAAFVASLGALYADPTRGFELLEGLNKEQQEHAYGFSKNYVEIQIAKTDEPLYIEAILKGTSSKSEGDSACMCCNTARVIVAGGHTSIQLIEYNGVPVNTSTTSDAKNLTAKDEIEDEDSDFSMKEVLEFANELQDFEIYKKAVELNLALSNEGKIGNWGLNIGKIHPFDQESVFSRVVSAATAGVDARMAGAELPAMACTGSGNQGITVTLPIYQTAQELGKDEETTFRAVAVGILSTIYVKRHLNVLSHLCGAVIASAGAAAGMVYLHGGNYAQAENAIQNVIVSVVGMFCDGAKITCALKVASGVSTAIYAATLALKEQGCVKTDVGIACKKLEDTIKNVAKIESNSSKVMEETILDIITDS